MAEFHVPHLVSEDRGEFVLVVQELKHASCDEHKATGDGKGVDLVGFKCHEDVPAVRHGIVGRRGNGMPEGVDIDSARVVVGQRWIERQDSRRYGSPELEFLHRADLAVNEPRRRLPRRRNQTRTFSFALSGSISDRAKSCGAELSRTGEHRCSSTGLFYVQHLRFCRVAFKPAFTDERGYRFVRSGLPVGEDTLDSGRIGHGRRLARTCRAAHGRQLCVVLRLGESALGRRHAFCGYLLVRILVVDQPFAGERRHGEISSAGQLHPSRNQILWEDISVSGERRRHAHILLDRHGVLVRKRPHRR